MNDQRIEQGEVKIRFFRFLVLRLIGNGLKLYSEIVGQSEDRGETLRKFFVQYPERLFGIPVPDLQDLDRTHAGDEQVRPEMPDSAAIEDIDRFIFAKVQQRRNQFVCRKFDLHHGADSSMQTFADFRGAAAPIRTWKSACRARKILPSIPSPENYESDL